MQKLKNSTLQKFVDCVIEVLKDENENKEHCGQRIYNIPFVISSLYQSFKNETNTYKDFISDLEKWSDYYVNVEDVKGEIAQVMIVLMKYKDIDEEGCYDDYECPSYDYRITFSYDERYYGYCMCTPDMEDYREDKKCCGHGCDATFSSFELHKITRVSYGRWDGDEHDYWDFEDEFYANDKELAEKIEKERREKEIISLKARIEADSKKLAELENR